MAKVKCTFLEVIGTITFNVTAQPVGGLSLLRARSFDISANPRYHCLIWNGHIELAMKIS